MPSNTIKPTSNKLLKSINQQKVLRLIFTHKSISRVELAEMTGLTQQTITNIVHRLLADGILQEATPVVSISGRRPIPLMIKSENLLAIGVEVAITYVRGSLMDFNRRVIKEVSVDVPVYESDEHPVTFIKEVIDKLISHVDDISKLKGIGCSIQGLVNSKDGVIIYSPGLRWRNFNLQERLEKLYDTPVYLENDANLLALSENLYGKLVNSRNNITFKLDFGIGGAIVIDKKLHTGSDYVAGEMGHYKAFHGEDAMLCHCGSKGCLTTLAASSGLRRNGGYPLSDFKEAILAKDPKALKLLDKISNAAGLAIGNICTFLNPDHVLFTGEMFDVLGELLLEPLTHRIMETVPESCKNMQVICLSRTPDESSSAVGLVMSHYLDIPLNTLSI